MDPADTLSVAFDSQISRKQNIGGITRYFQDLSQGLASHSAIDIVSSEHADILHATFYDGRPGKLENQKLISSLYDMTPELFADMFPLGRLRQMLKIGPHANKRAWLAKSDLIISISQSSADALGYVWPKLEGRINVIHLGTSIQNTRPKPVQKVAGQRFWLIVGKRSGYKNGKVLISAFKRLSDRQSTPRLFAAGGGAWSSEERSIITQSRISQFVHQQVVSDSELAWLYRNAEAVLVPSLAEGFSLPLIEALACNTPVIASDINVHREVAQTYASFIPASSIDDWAEILDLAAQESLISPKQMLGEEHWNHLTNYYSINRMVDEHVESYRQLK